MSSYSQTSCKMLSLLLLLLFHQITCWSPTENLNKYDKIIMQIFSKPKDTDKAKLLETLLVFIKTIVTATHELKTSDDIFEDCKKLYKQKDWMDFLYFEWDKRMIKIFKTRLNFTETEFEEYNALMRNSAAAWMQFLDAVKIRSKDNIKRQNITT